MVVDIDINIESCQELYFQLHVPMRSIHSILSYQEGAAVESLRILPRMFIVCPIPSREGGKEEHQQECP